MKVSTPRGVGGHLEDGVGARQRLAIGVEDEVAARLPQLPRAGAACLGRSRLCIALPRGVLTRGPWGTAGKRGSVGGVCTQCRSSNKGTGCENLIKVPRWLDAVVNCGRAEQNRNRCGSLGRQSLGDADRKRQMCLKNSNVSR